MRTYVDTGSRCITRALSSAPAQPDREWSRIMSRPEPAIAFRELLDYTDFLARRWMDCFKQHEAALAVDVGGRTGSLRDLVSHIFQVESFFASQLLESPSPRLQV